MIRLLLIAALLVGCGEAKPLEPSTAPPMFSIKLGSTDSQPQRILTWGESEDGTRGCLFEFRNGERLELRNLGCWDLEDGIEI